MSFQLPSVPEYTDEELIELEFFDGLEREWKNSLLNPDQRMRIFPKEYTIYLKNRITFLRERKYQLNNIIRLEKERWLREYEGEKYEEEIRHCLKELKIVSNIKSGIEFNIDTIKLIPITDWLTFNRAGFTRCIWHEEKSGSLKYYKKNNKVFCFGCGKHGDVIDVVQQLKNCDFKTALEYLN